METSGPFDSQKDADKWIQGQLKADSAAKIGTLNWKPDKLEFSS